MEAHEGKLKIRLYSNIDSVFDCIPTNLNAFDGLRVKWMVNMEVQSFRNLLKTTFCSVVVSDI